MQTETSSSNNRWLLKFLWKYRRWLIASMLAGALVAFSVTYYVTPYYSATAIVYPAGGQQGSDLHLKQGNTLLLMQLLESSFVTDSVITYFDLSRHYQVDTATKAGKSKLVNTYRNNTSFERTLYKSVRITVNDQEADFAARLANGIVNIANSINRKIYRDNTREKMDFFRQEHRNKLKEVHQLSDSLTDYQRIKNAKAIQSLRDDLKVVAARTERQRNLLKKLRDFLQVHNLNAHIDNVKKQYNEAESGYNEAMARCQVYQKYNRQDSLMQEEAAIAGYLARKKHLKEELDKLTERENDYNRLTHQIALSRSIYDDLRFKLSQMTTELEPEVKTVEMLVKINRLERKMKQLGQLSDKYEHARSQFNQPVPAAYMFSSAQPDYTVVYPRKLLIVGGAVVLMFVLTLSVLLIIKGHAFRNNS